MGRGSKELKFKVRERKNERKKWKEGIYDKKVDARGGSKRK